MSKKAVELAIELEKKGHEYYKEHAATADNPLAKKVLSSLAQQELDHLSYIEDYAAGKSISVADYEAANDIEAQVKEVFDEFSAKEREAWKTANVEVYEHAMELERDIYQAYQKLAAEAEDEAAQEFFEIMMEEESKHLESLENVHYFLTETGDWLASEESQVWNWMNT
ncbi:ferritin family protein [Fuchsiella alkaliacetigena]|uniref:ferritin family protein n=1 Tax=Fuchsiella alkaliacetigena TaxID=957042 RepID=UPI00200AE118|nr:ferritin family protein [Fuchsiella alkaliacetigena]MCK8825432.1 hypothetical protein [Fuchsiella alkaliacetigena]